MLELKPDTRGCLAHRRALARDGQGREVFVGLTRSESERYQALSDPLRVNTVGDAAEFLLLDGKHYLAMTRL